MAGGGKGEETVRMGFVGAGGNARGHMEKMARVPGVELVALADPSAEARAKASETVGDDRPMAVYKDYRELLAAEELDGVVISTPHTLHAEQVITCLDRGLHVLVEKPMACSVAEARQIMDKEREAGRVLMVGYQRHLNQRYRWAREQIAAGRIGRVTYIQAYQGQNWRRNTAGRWRQEPSLSGGGQLNDSGSHLVDAVLWISGLAPEAVAAASDRRGTPVDINTALAVRFAGGALGSLAVVGDQVAHGMWEDLTFAGEEGVIWLRRGGETYLATTEEPAPGLVEELGPAWPDRDQHFVDCMRGNAENQIPSVCGLRVIQLTEAAWQAAETGTFARVEAQSAAD